MPCGGYLQPTKQGGPVRARGFSYRKVDFEGLLGETDGKQFVIYQKEGRDCPSSSQRDNEGVNFAEGALLCGLRHHQTPPTRLDLSFSLGASAPGSRGDPWFSSSASEAAEACSEEGSLENDLRGRMAEMLPLHPGRRIWLGQMSSRKH